MVNERAASKVDIFPVDIRLIIIIIGRKLLVGVCENEPILPNVVSDKEDPQELSNHFHDVDYEDLLVIIDMVRVFVIL